MSKQKTLQLSKTRTQEFLKNLEENPSERRVLLYQAIIASLVAHIFILFVVHMLTEDNRLTTGQEQVIPLEMELLEEELQNLELQKPQENTATTGPLKDLTANENSARTNEAVNYRGKSQQQINEEVYKNLKNMEAEEFQRLKDGRPDYTSAPKDNGTTDKSSGKPNDYDWYKNASDKSYSGRVSASFNVKGREQIEGPKPTYRCKTQGTVVVNIVVGVTGMVTDAKVDETRSTMDDCLRSESVKYAQMWKFNYKEGEKKQDGTITFTFSAQ